MRKLFAFALAGFMVAATAATSLAADYDRYERGPARGPGVYAPPPERMAYAPPPRHAQYGQPYFFAHLGIFDPNTDFDGLDGYDTGGNFDIGVGSRVSPLFAIEGTLGGFSAERGPDEVTVVPLTIGGRLIIPHPFLEPYVGAGIGLYFSSLDEPTTGIDDTSTDVGGYLSIGADFWLNPRVALNIEGKYHWVEPTFRISGGPEVDVNLSGWTANLGVRVSF